MDVALVRWPAEDSRRRRLSAQGVPRLLLVDGAAAPPEAADCLEDWLRLPASDADVALRVATVAQRARHHHPEVPHLDADGVLRQGRYWVSLPPVEARLTAAFLERFGAVVSRDHLTRAGWPGGVTGRNVLDVHVVRLRRRLAPLGIAIRTVRSRGYLLELASDRCQEAVREA